MRVKIKSLLSTLENQFRPMHPSFKGCFNHRSLMMKQFACLGNKSITRQLSYRSVFCFSDKNPN